MIKIAIAEYDVNLFEINSFWEFLTDLKYSSLFILIDENTETKCLPLLETFNKTKVVYNTIKINAGEENKSLESCQTIWNGLISGKADRKSILVNLGGGVIGDMGGFCASTYMRGIRFIQIPTTLLSQVDASVGGKLGIDFHQLKNIIGLFRNPEAVFADPIFFKTLPDRQLKSGFAEIFKHALIKDINHWDALCEIDNLAAFNNWENILPNSIEIKKEVVESDPFESAYRKILNFGHSIGHAIESFYLSSPNSYLHGEAIALGMICESFLSVKKTNLSQDDLGRISKVLLKHYELKRVKEEDFDKILSLLQKDKKNDSGIILLSLLSEIGNCKVNIECQRDEIVESLRYFNTLIS